MSPTLGLRAIERSFASFRRNRLGRVDLIGGSGAPKVVRNFSSIGGREN